MRLRITLPAGTAYVYDSYVAPELRRRHVSSAAATRFARVLAKEGCTRMIATVAPESEVALGNARRGGYVEVGRMATLAPGPLPGLRVPYVGRSRR